MTHDVLKTYTVMHSIYLYFTFLSCVKFRSLYSVGLCDFMSPQREMTSSCDFILAKMFGEVISRHSSVINLAFPQELSYFWKNERGHSLSHKPSVSSIYIIGCVGRYWLNMSCDLEKMYFFFTKSIDNRFRLNIWRRLKVEYLYHSIEIFKRSLFLWFFSL